MKIERIVYDLGDFVRLNKLNHKHKMKKNNQQFFIFVKQSMFMLTYLLLRRDCFPSVPRPANFRQR